MYGLSDYKITFQNKKLVYNFFRNFVMAAGEQEHTLDELENSVSSLCVSDNSYIPSSCEFSKSSSPNIDSAKKKKKKKKEKRKEQLAKLIKYHQDCTTYYEKLKKKHISK